MPENFSELLLDRYHQGDSQAAAEIYARYTPRLLKLAQTRIFKKLQAKLGPDDVVQASFQSFFQLLDQNKVRWNQEGDLWRLLAGIAINQVKRQAEHYQTEKRSLDREQVLPSEIPSRRDSFDTAVTTELADLIDSLLDKNTLPRKVLLARMAGYTHPQIAKQIGRSERTVRRILQSLQAKLAQQYEFEWDFDHQVSKNKPAGSPGPSGLNDRIDDYDLLRMIGAGTFGKVYLARNHRNGQDVAIKVLKKSWLGNSRTEKLFLAEAEKISQLDHPQIALFRGAGPLPNGSWFIAMEYINGDHLGKVAKDSAKMLGVAHLMQLIQAIAYLHRNQVIHGDLQPANIIVSPSEIKLIDFGFATQTNEGDYHPALGGTDGFVAPELEASIAADIYSLGMLIELVARACRQFDPELRKCLLRIASELVHYTPQRRRSLDWVQAEFEHLPKKNR